MRIITALISVCLITSLLPAQQLPFKQYTTQDGLSQMQIQDMFRDSRGYLWLSTRDGVSWFNGSEFHKLGHAEGLLGHDVRSVREDDSGKLWIASNAGLCRFDGASVDTFLRDRNIRNLVCRPGGRIFFTARRGAEGIVICTLNGREIQTVHPPGLDMSSPSAIAMDQYRQLGMVIVYGDGHSKACQWDGQHAIKPLPTPPGITGISFLEQMGRVYLEGRDAKGRIHFYYYNPEQHCFTSVLHYDLSSASYEVHQTLDWNFYFICNYYDHKVHYLPSGSRQVETLFNSPSNPIVRIKIDEESQIQLATEQGLVILFSRPWAEYTNPEANNVWQIAEDQRGLLWFGSFATGQFSTFDGRQFSSPVRFPNWGGNSCCGGYGTTRDGSGNPYFIFNGNKGPQTAIFKNGRLDSLGTGAFLNYYDVERQLLLTGTCGNGLEARDAQGNTLNYSDGLFNKNYCLVAFEKDARGDYWAGTFYSLERLDWASKKWQKFDAFPSKGALSLYKDNRGKMWIGGTEGLYYHDDMGKEFRPIAPDMLKRMISDIEQLDERWLFIAAIEGVYILDLEAFYHNGSVLLQSLSTFNGYKGIEPSQNGFFKDSKGNLWLGSSTSTYQFKPGDWSPPDQSISVRITAANQKAVPFTLRANEVFSLPDDINDVTFEFETIGAARSFNMEYSWRLDDGQNWSAWSPYYTTTLNNLSPGLHHLHLRARKGNLDSSEDNPTVDFAFRVNIPIWRHPRFYVLAMAIISGLMLISVLIAWFYRRSDRRLKKQEAQARRLQEEADYRKIQTLQAQMNPHFIYNVLTSLQASILKSDIKTANEHLIRFSLMVRRFLDATVAENERFERGVSSDSEITLDQEIALLRDYLAFEQYSYPNKFSHSIDITLPDDPGNYSIPPMLIQPFVENAIKNGLLHKAGSEGMLKINFYRESDETLVCTVEDNGIGREKSREIRNRSLKMHKSLGSDLVRERINLLNRIGYDITISEVDRPGGGTIITIKIGYQE